MLVQFKKNKNKILLFLSNFRQTDKMDEFRAYDKLTAKPVNLLIYFMNLLSDE